MKKTFLGILFCFIMLTGCANVDVGLGIGVYHHVGPHRHGATYTHWVGPERKDEFRYTWEFQLGHQGHHHEHGRGPAPSSPDIQAPEENKPDTDIDKPKKKKDWTPPRKRRRRKNKKD